MFEHITFEMLIQRMMNRIANDVDKREGSIIYDAGAMTAKEFIETYIGLDGIMHETFPDTASRPNLIRRAAEYGVSPYPAEKAKLRAIFNRDVPLGSRFSLDDLNYTIVQRIVPNEYVAECEEYGKIGNHNLGALIPIEYIDGLKSAELVELLVPGEDEEETEDFRTRFFLSRVSISYGGNRDDYIEKVMGIPGVGAIKPFRAPNGGGTVGISFLDSDFNVPTVSHVNDVQTAIDPIVNSGEGLGIAPYGHRVTVKAADAVTVGIETKLVLSGVTLGQLQSEIEDILEGYLLSLRKSWGDSETIVVRKSQIEARILDLGGVHDISDTLINGVDGNLTLGNVEVPMFGSVVLHG